VRPLLLIKINDLAFRLEDINYIFSVMIMQHASYF
jgi:hypothetical protein